MFGYKVIIKFKSNVISFAVQKIQHTARTWAGNQKKDPIEI